MEHTGPKPIGPALECLLEAARNARNFFSLDDDETA
jgi:hypothetical protein